MTTATQRGNATRRDGDELTARGPGGTFDVRPFWLDEKGGACVTVQSWPMYASPMGPANGLPRDGFAVYRRIPGDYPNTSEHRHISDHPDTYEGHREAVEAAEAEAITRGIPPGGEPIRIRVGGASGPENVVTVDEFGGVLIECEGKRVKIDTQDPGPGGVSIFVDGEHVDGSP